MLIARLFPASAFFFCAERRKLDVTFFPRFFAGLSLRATYQLEQTRGTAAKIDIVAGRKFSRLHQKTVGIHCVENELPLNMFLSRENKRDWLIMRVDQQQERVVANWSPSKLRTSIVSPLSSMPRQRTNGDVHSSSLISLPPGLNHITSRVSEPRIRRP